MTHYSTTTRHYSRFFPPYSLLHLPPGKFSSKVGQSECAAACGSGYYYSFEPFDLDACGIETTVTTGCQLAYDGDSVENVICSYNNNLRISIDYYPETNKTSWSGRSDGDYLKTYDDSYEDYYRVYRRDEDSTNYYYYSPWIATSNYTKYTSRKIQSCSYYYNSYRCNSYDGYGYYDKPSCCTSCPVGSFCPVDDYQNQLCAPGSYSDTIGASTCKLCPSGTYNPRTGSSSYSDCDPCVAGTYNSLEGQTKCVPCPKNTYNSYSESISEDACLACASGYTSTEGASECSPCSPGFYRESDQTSCTPCDAGKYSSSYGATSSDSCQACPLGSANPYVGQSSCSLCQPGLFGNETGLSYCFSCPSSTFSVAGAVTCDTCSS